MVFKLVTDQIRDGKMYPGLAKWNAWPYNAEWYQFGKHWPYTTPLDVFEYCVSHNYPCEIFEYQHGFPANAFYPVSFGFFNFEIDYFSLLPQSRLNEIKQGQYRILFYYHEGDNPKKIQDRLDSLCDQHHLPHHCYRFVSGNTAADQLSRFIWFSDFELWFWQRNRANLPIPPHQNSQIGRAHV